MPERDEPLYIPAEPGPLFGVLHRTEQPSARAAALFLSPGFDERRSANGVMARLARGLAAEGAAVLRFDYYGTGDSAGDSLDVTVKSMERDAAAAAQFLRGLFPGAPLALVGVRLGASLALRLGGALGAARVAAVAPLASGATWLRQERGRKTLRRSMATREMQKSGADGVAAPPDAPLPAGAAEDLDGLPMTRAFIEEVEALDLLTGEPVASRPGGAEPLVIQVSPRRSPLGETAALARRFGARVECLNLEPFWQPLEHPPVEALAASLARHVLGGQP